MIPGSILDVSSHAQNLRIRRGWKLLRVWSSFARVLHALRLVIGTCCDGAARRTSNWICGRILLYAKQQVHAFREHLGLAVSIFKIGITSSPAQRFQAYLAKQFDLMWVIWVSQEAGTVLMLEAALIAEFQTCDGCRNAPNSGGEGSLSRQRPPYYLYVTGARADQLKRVAHG